MFCVLSDDCIDVNEESLLKILSLSGLESLRCSLIENFPHIEQPVIEHLSELDISIRFRHPIFTGLFEAIKKTPQLKKLLLFYYYSEVEEEKLSLIFGVVNAATSLGKDVLVNYFHTGVVTRKIRITKSSHHGEANILGRSDKTLECDLGYINKATFHEDVKELVRNKLHHYNAFVCK